MQEVNQPALYILFGARRAKIKNLNCSCTDDDDDEGENTMPSLCDSRGDDGWLAPCNNGCVIGKDDFLILGAVRQGGSREMEKLGNSIIANNAGTSPAGVTKCVCSSWLWTRKMPNVVLESLSLESQTARSRDPFPILFHRSGVAFSRTSNRPDPKWGNIFDK